MYILYKAKNAIVGVAAQKHVDNKQPGSVWALLANSRWEYQLLRFLEESGVGRIVGGDMDRRTGQFVPYFLFSFCLHFVKGDPHNYVPRDLLEFPLSWPDGQLVWDKGREVTM